MLGANHLFDWSITNSRVARVEPDRSDLRYVAAVDPATGTYTRGAWFSRPVRGDQDVLGPGRERLGRRRQLPALPRQRHQPGAVKFGAALRAVDRDADSQPYDVRSRGLSQAERAVAPEDLFDGAYADSGS